jgi:hypothetical protein
MSAIERAAVARTSTRVSSISMMIIRIIRAGSSARSRSSVMFAAKMSFARLNTGPLEPAGGGAGALEGLAAPSSSTGVRTGALASMISSSGIGSPAAPEKRDMGRRDGRADRDRAHHRARRRPR